MKGNPAGNGWSVMFLDNLVQKKAPMGMGLKSGGENALEETRLELLEETAPTGRGLKRFSFELPCGRDWVS